MRIMNLQCGQCGNLMAIGEENLGQQVQCPHCQQVVLAPASLPPESPPQPAGGLEETPFHAPVPAEAEGLSSRLEPDLTLADAPPLQPEAPREPVTVQQQNSWPLTPVAESGPQLPEAPTSWPGEAPAAAAAVASPPALADEPGRALTDGSLAAPESNWMTAPATAPDLTAPAPLSEALPHTVARRPPSRSWILILFIIPLISYSILSTILIIYLLRNRPEPASPFEKMLDQEGDFKGGTRLKPESMHYKRVKPDLPLPAQLRVRLDTKTPVSLQIGDLQVTPLRVELAKVVFLRGARPDPDDEDALVLTLQLRNISTDVVFSPTDPYFDRKWKENAVNDPMPYTFLEVGQKKRFYGPLKHPGPGKRSLDTLEGQHAGKALKPGEEMTTFVCTDPADHIASTLKTNPGPFLWRIHVRRGLERIGERDVSTTAVIGVEFTADDIRKPG